MKISKLTPGVLAQVVDYRDRGLSSAEIARELGCTLGTLRVKCSQHKISLRRRGGEPQPPEGGGLPSGFGKKRRLTGKSLSRGSLTLSLAQDTVDQPAAAGSRKGHFGLQACRQPAGGDRA